MRHRMFRLVLLGLVVLVAPGIALGSTIMIASGGDTTLDAAGLIPAETITPHPAWDPAAGTWVSDAQTGDPSGQGWVEAPTGTTPFFHSFLLPSGEDILLDASLEVWADDTAAVWLNGGLVYSNFAGPFNVACSSTPIGCLATTKGVFGAIDVAPFLNLGGANLFQFDVFQAPTLNATGLAYNARFDTTAAEPPGIPEPATMMLVGIGLLSVALVQRRKRQSEPKS